MGKRCHAGRVVFGPDLLGWRAELCVICVTSAGWCLPAAGQSPTNAQRAGFSMLTMTWLMACTSVNAPALDVRQQSGGREQATSFEVMFAPDDNPLPLEIDEIVAVTQARLADPHAPFEDYRIAYAVYNLRSTEVASALADAVDAGVDVQVLIEDEQLDSDADWSWFDDHLGSRGWSVVDDSREASVDELMNTPLVKIGGSGLMHLKMRLFETPNQQVLITGSMNPSDSALDNDDNWHRIEDPALFESYAGMFDAVLLDQDIVNTFDDDAQANVLFTPVDQGPHAGSKIFEWLEEEEEQILIAMFSLWEITAPGYDQGLLSVLTERAAAGVDVHVIVDAKQASRSTIIDELTAGGVSVHQATNTSHGLASMHHKAAILGRTNIRVITDAANWSTSGLGSATNRARNVESSLFLQLDDDTVSKRYMGMWMRLLHRYADQSADQISFDQLSAQLTSHMDWPDQQMEVWSQDADWLEISGQSDTWTFDQGYANYTAPVGMPVLWRTGDQQFTSDWSLDYALPDGFGQAHTIVNTAL